MKIVKVKIKGQWRNVIGTGMDREGHVCLKVQCEDKRYYNLYRDNDIDIQDKIERPVKRYPSRVYRLEELTEEQKDSVKKRFHSGAWTLKEICDMFNITRLTVKKIVGVL